MDDDISTILKTLRPTGSTGFEARNWEPKRYQQRGVEWLLKTEAALAFPPGLGKTSVALAAFSVLRAMGVARRMLVFAPLKVCQGVWRQEAQKWAEFQGLKIEVAHGPKKLSVLLDKTNDVVLLNYDAIAWLTSNKAWLGQFDVLCCDEIHKLKSTQTKRFKALKPTLGQFKFRWGLTGTPAANGYLDLFGQVFVLDQGKRLGKYITHYRAKYFYQKPWDQFGYYITEENEQAIAEKLSDLFTYVNPDEWLDLPEFLPIIVNIEMPAKLKAQYKFFDDEYILALQDTTLIAANAGVLSVKLRQFTSGAIYTEGREFERIHDLKIEALQALVDELSGEPLLVAYEFQHELVRLREVYPNALIIQGGMSDAAMDTVLAQWNSGQYPVLLAQSSVASLGLNLQAGGCAICWFTWTYNLEHYIQMNKRLHRQGQTKPVRCYLLTMEGTKDEDVNKVLADKDSTQNRLFAALTMEM